MTSGITRPIARWFTRLSVPDKIRLLIVLTSASALLVATGLISVLEVAGYRQQLVNNVSTLAQVAAANASAATEFEDAAAAYTLVRSLASEPSIDSAGIFSAAGPLLARHESQRIAERSPNGATSLQALRDLHGIAFDTAMFDSKSTRTAFHDDHLDAIAPVRLDGEAIGFVHVQANLVRMYETLALYAWTALIIVLAAMAIAYAATVRLRDSLSAPLLNLVDIMKHVSEHQDYQARAGKTGNDEIGALVDGFNNMLEQILERDRRLEEHRRFLERQINERTAHLERTLDDARQASKAKSEFLARMSHEIRTPMNGVLGMTELLRNSSLDVRQRRLVDTVYKSGESLLQIINDILDFSKVEAGRMQLAHVDFSLRDAVEEACEMLSERADAKGLELICAIGPGIPAWINGDPLRLKQILINLIGNAIKFTDRGEIVVRAVAVRSPASQGTAHLRFEVNDTGPGIDQADRERLFEAFTQAEAATTRVHGGTGLGLAIARELVTLMQGRIGVESRLGHGATFWFEIPFVVAAQPATLRVPRNTLKGSRALVVDDNAINREILEEYLRSWGMDVVTAVDGEEALAKLKAPTGADRRFDVVILDHKMPRMDGMTCLTNMRASPTIAATRVILLSSMDLALRHPELRSLDIDEALTKPVRQARLHAALIRVLGHDVSMQTMQMRAMPRTVEHRPAKLGHVRLLLVEDNDINREVALGMLAALDCEARVAVNGAQAVETFAREEFDAILMDCHMPVMDGYTAAATIRALELQHNRKRTPILALTANAMDGGRERCITAGMDDFLVKPFTLAQLRTLLEHWAQTPLAAKGPPAATPAEIGKPSAIDQPETGEQAAVLNGRAIEVIEGLRSPGLVERMIALYEARAPELVQSGNAAVADNDADALATAAHELKSSSANLGGERLARACKDCERAARNGDQTGLHALWAEVCAEFERFRGALRTVRPRATGT